VPLNKIESEKWGYYNSNYRVTEKHYIDKSVVASDLSKKGFRMFPKNQKGHSKAHSTT
jgi:hypothetical protein